MGQEKPDCYYQKPTLYTNGSDESREALRIVLESKIPCRIEGPISQKTPQIRRRYEHYIGLSEIEKFVKREIS